MKVLIRVGDTPFEMAKALCGDGARWKELCDLRDWQPGKFVEVPADWEVDADDFVALRSFELLARGLLAYPCFDKDGRAGISVDGVAEWFQ